MTQTRTKQPADTPPPPAGGARALVHIGLNKTGSTSIQAWLARNRDKLRDHGVVHDTLDDVPAPFLAHIEGFPAIALTRLNIRVSATAVRRAAGIDTMQDQKKRVADFTTRAEASIAAAGNALYVISSECIAAWLAQPARIRALDSWLHERFTQVDYVLYLRDQTEWLPSAYTQMIKMGGSTRLDDFIELRGEYDYNQLVKRWVNIVGPKGLNVRLLERDFLTNGDLISDFAALIGVDAADFDNPGRMNEGLSGRAVFALRRAHALYKALGQDNNEALNARTRSLILRLLNDPAGKLRLSASQAARVSQINADSNERLRARLFGDRPSLFSGTPKVPQSGTRPTNNSPISLSIT